MSKYDPPRGELKLRLVISLFILGLIVAAFFVKGAPSGLVGIELFLFGGSFAIGSVLWCLWKLTR